MGKGDNEKKKNEEWKDQREKRTKPERTTHLHGRGTHVSYAVITSSLVCMADLFPQLYVMRVAVRRGVAPRHKHVYMWLRRAPALVQMRLAEMR